jgi:hypothetical protein
MLASELPMSQPHELRFYEYVNHPYPAVREALRDHPELFQRATTGATGRAGEIAASLSVDLGAVEIGADVKIEVASIDELTSGPGGRIPTTCLKLRWKAARAAALFPAMEAELFVYPLSSGETQLDLHGHYRPPLGALGSAIDSLVLHRIAEASVHRFVTDVAKFLRSDLS